LVYVPTEEEIKNPTKVDFINETNAVSWPTCPGGMGYAPSYLGR
jgi:hypothetical protein